MGWNHQIETYLYIYTFALEKNCHKAVCNNWYLCLHAIFAYDICIQHVHVQYNVYTCIIMYTICFIVQCYTTHISHPNKKRIYTLFTLPKTNSSSPLKNDGFSKKRNLQTSRDGYHGSRYPYQGHAVCTHSGETATCLNRIHWTKQHVFSGRTSAADRRKGDENMGGGTARWMTSINLGEDLKCSNDNCK